MMMGTGADDNNVDGDGAMGNEVDDNGDGTTGNKVDDDGDGATGDDNNDDDSGNGDGVTGNSATGYNDDDNGDGRQWYNCVSMMYSTLLYCSPGRGAAGQLTNKHKWEGEGKKYQLKIVKF